MKRKLALSAAVVGLAAALIAGGAAPAMAATNTGSKSCPGGAQLVRINSTTVGGTATQHSWTGGYTYYYTTGFHATTTPKTSTSWAVDTNGTLSPSSYATCV